MPGFNVADVVTCLLRRVNYVGQPHPTVMQKTEAFRAGEGVKPSRIQIFCNKPIFDDNLQPFDE
jgi:hypothetical protein